MLVETTQVKGRSADYTYDLFLPKSCYVIFYKLIQNIMLFLDLLNKAA